MNYPDDSIQASIDPSPWWIKHEEKCLERGCLVAAFVPHIDQIPYTVIPKGRKQAEEHGTAEVEIKPLEIKKPRRYSSLPVAAMPIFDNEILTAYRAKKRPCLVLGAQTPHVDDRYRRGMPKKSTAPVVLAAPYYGADKDGKRAGYHAELVDRIRHAKYAQFLVDSLPIGGPKESILRLDHLQPIGTHYNSYELTGYKLSEDALKIMDEWLHWLIYSRVPNEDDSFIRDFQAYADNHFT